MTLQSCIALLILTANTVFAQTTQEYPAKAVRVVVASGAGGGTDFQTRMFAQKLTESLKRPFIVENRPGGGGALGYTYVAKSSPDGYTLLATANAFTINPALIENAGYDPIRDFAPVALLAKFPFLVVVHPSVPSKSIKELIALAKARPGALKTGVSNGSTTHLATAWLASLANINVAFIPYKITTQIVSDTVSGQIELLIANVVPTTPQVKAGRLRALAVTSGQRYPMLPDLPTVSESGVAGYDISAWNGWLAPVKTPDTVVNKLSQELTRLTRSREVIDQLERDGGIMMAETPEQFSSLLHDELERWRGVVKRTGMRLE